MLKKILSYVSKALFEPILRSQKTDEQRLVDFYSGKHHKTKPHITDKQPTNAN